MSGIGSEHRSPLSYDEAEQVAKPDFAALGLGSEWEAEGRN